MFKKIILTFLAIFSPIIAFAVHSQFSRVDLGSTGEQMLDVSIGNGRNDGVNRVYVGAAGSLYEFTQNSGSWSKNQIYSNPPNGMYGVSVGNGRNDGINRVYSGIGASVFEFTWNGSAWTQGNVGGGLAYMSDTFLGQGRNDGVNRLYVAGSDNNVYEFSWNGVSWDKATIGSAGGNNKGIVVGAGRNDGTNRIYVASNDKHLYEFSWTGSWNKLDMGSGTNELWGVTLGNARNDSTKRVYCGGGTDVFEYVWSGSWTRQKILSGNASSVYRLTTGIINNTNKLYMGDTVNGLYEFSFQNSTWSYVIVDTNTVWGVEVGSVRNDGINRIYTGNVNNHSYEYFYNPTIPISVARGIQGADGKRNPGTESNITISGIATVSDGVLLVHNVYDYSSFYIQDNTGGINVYKEPVISTYIQQGDSITISGTIFQYNGLTEITDPTAITIHSSNNSLPAALEITCAQAGAVSTNGNDGGELYEGKLIKVKNARIKSVSNKTDAIVYTINDGTGDLSLWAYNMTDIKKNNIVLNNTFSFDITGILIQNGTTTPRELNNYYIAVRSIKDLVGNFGYISGKITKSDNIIAISGALIQAFQNNILISSSIVDSSGNLSLILAAGTYDIQASSDGYQSQTKTGIIVAANQTTTVNFALLANNEAKPQPEFKNTTIGNNIFSAKSGGSAKVGFSVPATGRVTLKIFDLSGVFVKTLLDEERSAGNYQVDWSGRNFNDETLPPGLYFLVYEYPGGKEVRKIGIQK